MLDDDDDIDSAFGFLLLHLQWSPRLHYYFCLNLQVRIALSSLNKIKRTELFFSFCHEMQIQKNFTNKKRTLLLEITPFFFDVKCKKIWCQKLQKKIITYSTKVFNFISYDT